MVMNLWCYIVFVWYAFVVIFFLYDPLYFMLFCSDLLHRFSQNSVICSFLHFLISFSISCVSLLLCFLAAQFVLGLWYIACYLLIWLCMYNSSYCWTVCVSLYIVLLYMLPIPFATLFLFSVFLINLLFLIIVHFWFISLYSTFLQL